MLKSNMEKTLVMGTVGSDIHSVANTLIEKELSEKGFFVINLGVAVPEIEWLNVISKKPTDLVLIGSMNGDLLPVIQLVDELKKLISPEKIIVGGKLNLGSESQSLSPFLRAMGVNVMDSDAITFKNISDTCLEIVGFPKVSKRKIL